MQQTGFLRYRTHGKGVMIPKAISRRQPENPDDHIWQIHHRPVPWLGGFQRSDLYRTEYVPLTHVLKKNLACRIILRASGSQSDMFLTAELRILMSRFEEGSTFHMDVSRYFPMKQRECNHKPCKPLPLFLYSFYLLLYSFSIRL